MCQKSKIISRVKNGELSICKGCKAYSLIFNNIYFQFDKNQLEQFRDYILKIDIDYWLDHNSCTVQKRKIPVATYHQNLILVFDRYEIEELKELLCVKKEQTKEIISTAEIDYTLILN